MTPMLPRRDTSFKDMQAEEEHEVRKDEEAPKKQIIPPAKKSVSRKAPSAIPSSTRVLRSRSQKSDR
ncbi:unnamed protein product [Cylicostephanus goldi]|uniref:Uncharacterized protein n=1 Tax=Cylicostephanus goldi TaxID=71465 RepID=A0A3P7MH00_CYLGO|nr:unnamed protein product [Cylicostephanus goldi]